MYIDLEPLQGKPWHELMTVLVKAADRLAKEYQSPFKNDARGTLDCYQLEDKLHDCMKILNRYNQKEQ